MKLTEQAKWTVWEGGECPVNPASMVEYRTRDGGQSKSFADDLDWRHFSESSSVRGGDITSYRVVRP